MSLDDDYMFALEMQNRINAERDGDGNSDIEEIDFKKPTKSLLASKAPFKSTNPQSSLDEHDLNRTQNLVHPQWETLDPTPDVHALFGQFDTKFFQSRLKCVTLEWSKRMYSCAGICYSRKNRYGMDITIRLSQPLLTFRPRKDLVQTMLHEMIHAYCFVLNIREGNGGHGPNFKRIMNAINKVAGTNITVYHTFNDEVEMYKQHWWRCNGICQDRSPFYGYVKRTSNRAPGPNDQWWAIHMRNCGGTFMKIKGPETKNNDRSTSGKENGRQKKSSSNGVDLRKFFPPKIKKAISTTDSNIKDLNNFNNGFKGSVKTNGGGTMLLNPKTKSISSNSGSTTKPHLTSSIAKAFPPSSYPGLSTNPFDISNSRATSIKSVMHSFPHSGNLHNVWGLRDLGGLSSGNSYDNNQPSRNITSSATHSQDDWGHGNLLTSTSPFIKNNTCMSSNSNTGVNRQNLRDIWSKRFGNNCSNSGANSSTAIRENRNNIEERQGGTKRRRISADSERSAKSDGVLNDKKDWIVVDDDIMLQEEIDKVITLSSDEDDVTDSEILTKSIINRNMTLDQRQTLIKKEIIDESIDLCDDDIELIDDEYDDNEGNNVDLYIAAELADTSIIDEFFGEDTLMKEFEKENDCQPSSSHYTFDKNNDIITCPICQEKMTRTAMAEHLNGCTGITVKVLPPKSCLSKLSVTSRKGRSRPKNRNSPRKSDKDILRLAGYSEDVLQQISSASSIDEEEDLEYRRAVRAKQTNSSKTSPTTNSDVNSSLKDENSRLYRQRSIYKTTRQCPVCTCEVEETEINDHLDECISK